MTSLSQDETYAKEAVAYLKKIHSIINEEAEYKSESVLACTILTKVIEKQHNYNIAVSFHIWRKATSEADAAEVVQDF